MKLSALIEKTQSYPVFTLEDCRKWFPGTTRGTLLLQLSKQVRRGRLLPEQFSSIKEEAYRSGIPQRFELAILREYLQSEFLSIMATLPGAAPWSSRTFYFGWGFRRIILL